MSKVSDKRSGMVYCQFREHSFADLPKRFYPDCRTEFWNSVVTLIQVHWPHLIPRPVTKGGSILQSALLPEQGLVTT